MEGGEIRFHQHIPHDSTKAIVDDLVSVLFSQAFEDKTPVGGGLSSRMEAQICSVVVLCAQRGKATLDQSKKAF